MRSAALVVTAVLALSVAAAGRPLVVMPTRPSVAGVEYVKGTPKRGASRDRLLAGKARIRARRHP